MSLWADYYREKLGWTTIETDFGFVSFSVRGSFMRIEEIYVIPEARKSGHAKDLADRVSAEGRRVGCSHLWAHVTLNANGSTDSLKAVLAYGFLAIKADQDHIYLTKELTATGGPDGP